MLIPNQKVKVRWNSANKKHYESKGYPYTKMRDEFEIDIKDITKGSRDIVEFKCDHPECNKVFPRSYKEGAKRDNQYCSKKCSISIASKESIKKNSRQQKYECSYCGEDVWRTPNRASLYHNVFCSKECSDKGNIKRPKNRTYVTCLQCSDTKEVVKSKEKQMFCSNECKMEYQKTLFIGENNPNYSGGNYETECTCCNEHISVPQARLRRSKNGNLFCSYKCSRKWFKEVTSKNEEYINRRREIAIESLNKNKYKTQTSCQNIVDNILNELKIKNEREKGFKYFSIDNYLYDYNLAIEVMGTFWHTDHRFYDEIIYDMQLRGIKSDKIKQTYMKKYENINILYLWEYDIETNPSLCKELIKLYINKNGQLEDLHSFNYKLIDDNLSLEKNIEIPYFYMDKRDVEKHVKLNNEESRKRKQRNTKQNSKKNIS